MRAAEASLRLAAKRPLAVPERCSQRSHGPLVATLDERLRHAEHLGDLAQRQVREAQLDERAQVRRQPLDRPNQASLGLA